MTLVITRGLHGSGKTTLARGWVDGYGGLGRVRVNRDDLRLNLFGAYWGLRPDQEDAVTVAQVASVRALLLSGASVIVDDTNLRPQDAERWSPALRTLSGRPSLSTSGTRRAWLRSRANTEEVIMQEEQEERVSPFVDSSRPVLLDLFCCEGGMGKGYAQAGFRVLGVDIAPQPNYPLEFHQEDALVSLAELADSAYRGWFAWHDENVRPVAVHASPPCQSRTTMSNRWRGAGGKADSHRNLIAEVREALEATGLPYVIENVPGARKDLRSPVVLTGEMFGLRVHRPRLFETNWPLMVPPKPRPSRDSIGVYGKAHDGRLLWRRKDGSEQRAAASLEEAREAMGMPWASWRGCAEAVPPAYAEFIGTQLFSYLSQQEAAA